MIQAACRHAIEDFVQWYYLEDRRLAPGTINGRLAAVRRLAYEAADAGLRSRYSSRHCLIFSRISQVAKPSGIQAFTSPNARLRLATCPVLIKVLELDSAGLAP